MRYTGQQGSSSPSSERDNTAAGWCERCYSFSVARARRSHLSHSCLKKLLGVGESRDNSNASMTAPPDLVQVPGGFSQNAIVPGERETGASGS